MAEAHEEAMAVLRMVAAGTVAPEEALDLLEALLPLPAGTTPPADALIPLRVHFEMAGREMDFALPADPAASLGEVLGLVLGMLPPEARALAPEGLLGSGLTVAGAPEDRLVYLEHDRPGGNCELQIVRQAFRFDFGRRFSEAGVFRRGAGGAFRRGG